LFDRLLEGLPTGAAVLDLGCGTGRPIAGLLVARGMRVTGIDHAAAMLAEARQAVQGANWCQAELDAPLAQTFAAAVCWDAIFHLERARHATVFREVWRALSPGGRFLFTTGGSAQPPFTDTMFGQEFFDDAPAPAETLALVQAAGFGLLGDVMLEPPRGGREKGRMAVLAEKPAT
jgi:SAM-dependent methyltransferase